MREIKIYHSHMEISPYESGDSIKLERSMVSFDRKSFTATLVAYFLHNKKLYLPRGINPKIIENNLGKCKISVVNEYSPCIKTKEYETLFNPRGKIQEEAINFLTGEERFRFNRSYSQKMLTLDTGDGKTFSTIYSILKLRERAIILTHATNIKKQWINSFHNMTNVPKDRMLDISSSGDFNRILDGDNDYDFFFVNHKSIQSFANKYGWDKITEVFNSIKVGIKVVDEVHKYLENTIRVDMFTNCKLSIYLTATPERSNQIENGIFKRAFNSAAKFGTETKSYDEKRKHIIYMPILFNSHASTSDIYNMTRGHGFSSNFYTEYAFFNDTRESIMYVCEYMLERTAKLEGKTLITTSRLDAIDLIHKRINLLDLNKTISQVHSKQTNDENEESKKSDIIISTVAGGGTGFDIPKLRVLINTEPFSSQLTFNQLKGRLREYSPTDDTYFIDLIDVSIPKCVEFYKFKLKYAKSVCKKIIIDDSLLKE